MESGSFWYYVVLEVLLITGIWVIYLKWRKRRLNAKPASSGGQEGSQALDIDSYTDLVNKEILKTEAKLAQLADKSNAEPGLVHAVQARLTFLRAEHEAASDAADNDETFWPRMTELLSGCFPAPAEADKPVSDREDQSPLIEALQTRIQAYETRIGNLEQFKQLFFDIKMKQVNSKGLEEKIRTEVDRVIPEQEQTPELRDMLSTLREENHTLEEQLIHLEHELDDVLRAAGPVGNLQTDPGEGSGSRQPAGLEGDVENIRLVIAQYKKHVNQLNDMVMDLTLDAKDKERLEGYAGELKSQYEDLQAATHHLEEENDFLQEQISVLLKQELEKEAEIKADAAEAKESLEAQLIAYAELEGKYAAMEQMYLTAYQENQKLTGAAGSS